MDNFNKEDLQDKIQEGQEGFTTDLFEAFLGDLIPKWNQNLDKIKAKY